MSIIRLKEIAGSPVQDHQGTFVLQSQGITVVDTTNTLKLNDNYLITIYKIASSPTVEVTTDGDNTEQHD